MAQIRETENDRSAAYGAWGTMKNAIEGLAQGVHQRIDRTAFPGMSGGAQTALLAGLRFLGLITADGTPTPALHALAVPDEVARKKQLETILRERYADLFVLNLAKTTPALLEEKMGESYNVSGTTRDKAVRFFLAALEYLEIPISPLFRRSGGNGTVVQRKRRGIGRPRGTPDMGEAVQPDTGGTPPAMTRTVTFKNGDTLTVSASLNLFSLDEEERAFALELIDKLRKYEQTHQEGGRTS